MHSKAESETSSKHFTIGAQTVYKAAPTGASTDPFKAHLVASDNFPNAP